MASQKKSKKRSKRKKTAGPRSSAKKKTSSKMANAHRKFSSRKTTRKKKKQARGRPAPVDMVSFEPRGLGARSGGQAGDLQGLSGVEHAASESVEELLEEGNAYEADIVKGVEGADSADEMEVETHEVPEDDVPEEYRDQN